MRGHRADGVIIGSSYDRVPDVVELWKALAAPIGGTGCRAHVDLEYQQWMTTASVASPRSPSDLQGISTVALRRRRANTPPP